MVKNHGGDENSVTAVVKETLPTEKEPGLSAQIEQLSRQLDKLKYQLKLMRDKPSSLEVAGNWASQQEGVEDAQRKLQSGRKAEALCTDAEGVVKNRGGDENSVTAVVKETLPTEKEPGLSAQIEQLSRQLDKLKYQLKLMRDKPSSLEVAGNWASQQEGVEDAQRKLQSGRKAEALCTDAEGVVKNRGGDENSVTAVVKETLPTEKEPGLSAQIEQLSR